MRKRNWGRKIEGEKRKAKKMRRVHDKAPRGVILCYSNLGEDQGRKGEERKV